MQPEATFLHFLMQPEATFLHFLIMFIDKGIS